MTDENVAYKDEPLVELKSEQISGETYMMANAGYWHFTVTENIRSAIMRTMGKGHCAVSMENFNFVYHPNCEDERLQRDYVCPDIMIMCDKSKIKERGYFGVPRFIVEVLSASTAHKDRTIKMQIYETAGVSEYWMVSPETLDIYYLVDGHYKVEHSYILCDDKDDEDYNVDTPITLRCFPQVTMTLGGIFEDLLYASD